MGARDTWEAMRWRIGPVSVADNQSCQHRQNRMDVGRRRRQIVEGKSLRGENETEWDSDRERDG